jgi:hypothetical protein
LLNTKLISKRARTGFPNVRDWPARNGIFRGRDRGPEIPQWGLNAARRDWKTREKYA